MTATQHNFDLRAAPMAIGRVRLRVRDLGGVAGFYRDAIGLDPLRDEPGVITLGTAGRPLLELVGDPALRARDRRDASLFHTAFRLPGRADLARWLAFAGAQGVALLGASDHGVSEAVYLADPEGNGIEVYADWPTARWRDADGNIQMTTERLDIDELLAVAGTGAWAGYPAEGSIGHVHLQVGDEAQAERFYAGVLGFEPTTRMRGARFFGSGGYHHQLAANVWNSAGAGPRPDDAAGLAAVEVTVSDSGARDAILARAREAGVPLSTAGDIPVLADPWGTAITLTVRGAPAA